MNQSVDPFRKFTLRLVARGLPCLMMAASAAAFAQSAPIEVGSPLYTSFQIPTVNGSLRYSLSASDDVSIGYNGQNQVAESVSLSANVGYVSASIVHPFDMTYSGGFLATTTGQPSSFFHNLNLTQSYNTKAWRFTVQDSLHYLPQAASSGLSGIPGQGDLGVAGAVPSQDVLTPYSTRIDNDTSFDVSRVLTGRTTATGTFYYAIERFTGNAGLESNDLTGRGSVNHRVSARTSISTDYTYSSFSYVGQSDSFASQTLLVDFTRQVTRRLDIGVGAGPERVLNGTSPSYTYSARAHLTYIASVEHGQSYNLLYNRATSSGSGISVGAESDTVAGTASRRFTRSLQGTVEAHYSQSSSYQLNTNQPIATKSVVASAQANRAIGRTLSVFCSYTLQHQISQGTALGLAPLNGSTQILGFGLTYSPSQVHLGRQ